MNESSSGHTIKDVVALTEPSKYLSLAEYSVPTNIELREGRLYWQPVKEWRQVRPITETFKQFVALADKGVSDKQVLRFARKWGVLGLCKKHLEPLSDIRHKDCVSVNPEPAETPDDYPPAAIHVWEKHFESEGEPVSEYRRWGRIAKAILAICQDLDRGRRADFRDWKVLGDERWTTESWETIASKLAMKDAITIEKMILAQWLERWLQIGNVHLRVAWNGVENQDVTVSLEGGGLLGAIAQQLLEFTTSYRILACTGCRRLYHPPSAKRNKAGEEYAPRRPKFGQANYCEDCDKSGVPIARAKRRKAVGIAKAQKQKG
jgi:hypothetical protein